MTPRSRAICLILTTMAWAGPGVAQGFSLVGEGGFFHGSRAPERLIQASAPANPQVAGPAPSLFRGRAEGSFFAPRAAAPVTGASTPAPVPLGGSQVARLRHLIASAEAGRDGYDAVQHGARVPTPTVPTAMTLAEIYAWIAATPGQPHAIGRYQMIPTTLKRLVRHAGVGLDARFTPALQDRLADQLLAEAGYGAFTGGEMGRRAFMNNLAKIWAGLPNSSGRSHYHGYAGNRATMSWAHFDAEMARIFTG